MKALTIWQPWASAIACGAKRIENRGWAPPFDLLGETFAIHAAKRPMDEDDAHEVFEKLGLNRGTHNFVDWVHSMPMGCVVALACLGEVRRKNPGGDQNQWWAGPIGWGLVDIKRLKKPVLCRGMQGLWELPEDVERQVRAQVGP